MTTVQPHSREIRVFLSSTFKDMEAERNHLIKQVFPKVRVACQERQVGFTEIDLRWGVTEEDSKNGTTASTLRNSRISVRHFHRHGSGVDHLVKHVFIEMSIHVTEIILVFFRKKA